MTQPEAKSSGLITDLTVINNIYNGQFDEVVNFLSTKYPDFDKKKFDALTDKEKSKILELVYISRMNSSYLNLKDYLQRKNLIQTDATQKVKAIVKDITTFIVSNSFSLKIDNTNDFIVELVKVIYNNLELQQEGVTLIDEFLIYYIDGRLTIKQKLKGYFKALRHRNLITAIFFYQVSSCL